MAGEQNSDEMVYSLMPQPGVRRDGTFVDGAHCSDGQWVRFQRGRAKKMGGYRRVTDALLGPVRKFLLWSRKDLNACVSFSEGAIETLLVDNNFIGNDINDRTPVSGFVSDPRNMWTADSQYDDAVSSQGAIIVAHCNQNLTNIDEDSATKPFWALASSVDSIFATITDAPEVSGGVFCIAPYTILYGSDGAVHWSDANQPQVWAGSTNPGDAGSDRITGSKIIAGLPLRSGQLSGILWSQDSVLRMDYVGGTAVWRFSTLSTQSSIIAQNSVIEYDGTYFWIGADRFLYFDTSVKELPNDMNQNWFFDNLNYSQRQKIWATKVPRFGEIWWFYPRGEATECSHAVIFNTRLKTWYDIELPRSAGFYAQILNSPAWIGSSAEPSDAYGLYQHEVGRNAIVGDNETAICSFYTTQNFGFPTGGVSESAQGLSRYTRLTRVEPDFVQEGSMTCSVVGKEFAQGAMDPETAYVFTPDDGKIDMREQRRHVALKFESNTLNGFFEAGKVIIHTEPGDNRS